MVRVPEARHISRPYVPLRGSALKTAPTPGHVPARTGNASANARRYRIPALRASIPRLNRDAAFIGEVGDGGKFLQKFTSVPNYAAHYVAKRSARICTCSYSWPSQHTCRSSERTRSHSQREWIHRGQGFQRETAMVSGMDDGTGHSKRTACRSIYRKGARPLRAISN